MTVWDLSFSVEQLVLDLALVSGLFLLGVVARRYVGLLQRFLIPSSLIAGFVGLMLGPELFGWVDFSTERMGAYVYHLLALTFISVGLQSRNGRTKGAVAFGFMQIMTFLVQFLLGLAIALLITYFINPDFIPAVGTLLPLGLGMGPGIAYSIGQSWESYGFAGAGSIGLTISAFGFLVAYVTGILVVNRGIRKGQAALVSSEESLSEAVRTGIIKEHPPEGARLTFFVGTIEPLTFHLSLIGGVYLLTYALLKGVAMGLVAAGLEREVVTLWSFHFIIANLIAIVVRRVMDALKVSYVVDLGLMHRSTGFFADVLIATSIMAISVQVAQAYLGAVMLMCILGTILTFYILRWTSERAFADYHFERFGGIYGEMTGTISSGLALIRVVDPEFRTPVGQDLVLGSGIAFILGFPLLILINLPFNLYDGALRGYWVVMGAAVVYLLLVMAAWSRLGLKRKANIKL